MFQCKVCSEKDRRIADLKEQTEFLRAEVRRVTQAPQQTRFVDVNTEMNALLSGEAEQLEPHATHLDPEVLAERDALLSGDY